MPNALYTVGLCLPMNMMTSILRYRACVDPAVRKKVCFNAPYITLVTGINETDIREVTKFIRSKLPMKIKTGKLVVLPSDGEEVVAKVVLSEELIDLNERLCDTYEVTSEHSYPPHITIGFIRLGLGDVVLTLDERVPCPENFSADDIVAFDPDGKKGGKIKYYIQ